MPAWRRYTGGFYAKAGQVLGQALAAGAHVLIICGGYGVLRADEPVGIYEKKFRLSDWPPGLVCELLVDEAASVNAEAVVAFTGTSTDYALETSFLPGRTFSSPFDTDAANLFFQGMSTACTPSGRLSPAFAAVAKYYTVAVDLCPARHGNRKGVVDKANHAAAQRWWRTLADDATVSAAQTGSRSSVAQCARRAGRTMRSGSWTEDLQSWIVRPLPKQFGPTVGPC